MLHLKRAWYAETQCERNLNCQRWILWRDWFVWQCSRWKIAMNKQQSTRTQLHGKCCKWSIWRILLICLNSQLTHKYTFCIFRDLLQLLWFRKQKKGSTLILHPCNLIINKKENRNTWQNQERGKHSIIEGSSLLSTLNGRSLIGSLTTRSKGSIDPLLRGAND